MSVKVLVSIAISFLVVSSVFSIVAIVGGAATLSNCLLLILNGGLINVNLNTWNNYKRSMERSDELNTMIEESNKRLNELMKDLQNRSV